MYFHPQVYYHKANEDRRHAILKYFKKRIFTDEKSVLCAVTGRGGQGKSYVCGSVSEVWAKQHNINYECKKHVLFTLKDAIWWCLKENEDKLEVGTILNMEELQLEGNVRDWQSKNNKILNGFISLMRYKRIILLFNTQYLEHLDSQMRKHFICEIDVQGFDKNTGESTLIPRFLEYNKVTHELNRKRLIVNYRREGKKGYGQYKLHDWITPKPSNEWIKVYEPLARTFKDDKMDKWFKELDSVGNNNNKDSKPKTFQLVAESFKRNGDDLVKIRQDLPHLSPYTLKDYLKWIKSENIGVQVQPLI